MNDHDVRTLEIWERCVLQCQQYYETLVELLSICPDTNIRLDLLDDLRQSTRKFGDVVRTLQTQLHVSEDRTTIIHLESECNASLTDVDICRRNFLLSCTKY